MEYEDSYNVILRCPYCKGTFIRDFAFLPRRKISYIHRCVDGDVNDKVDIVRLMNRRTNICYSKEEYLEFINKEE